MNLCVHKVNVGYIGWVGEPEVLKLSAISRGFSHLINHSLWIPGLTIKNLAIAANIVGNHIFNLTQGYNRLDLLFQSICHSLPRNRGGMGMKATGHIASVLAII